MRAATQFTRAMDEPGIQMVFARSSQGEGRVERMAGTFQNRLVSELRLAGASTILEANRVLGDFLPRFNERFRVPAEQPGAAYRPLDPDICLDRIFCYKHWRRVGRDNTVTYRWRTLQLLPDVDPGSYAGSEVEVLEAPDRTLWVQHEERIIPSQGAPSRPGVLRGSTQMPARNVHPTARTAGGCTSTRRSRQAQRLVASMEHVRSSLCGAGRPVGDRGRGGRRSIEPRFRTYPIGQSQGTWV